jgi:WD40 repeat protein
MSAATLAVPVGSRTPWKGLAPYDDSAVDAKLFFGRDREIDVACANLRAARLTVLFGASGVGKSSLLRAGVMRRLRAEGEAAALVSSWAGDPVAAVAAAARDAVQGALGRDVDDPGGPLAARLRAWTDELDGDLLLVLDQMEEYFLYHDGDGAPGSFAAEFPDLVTERGLRVNVMLGIREDALGVLDTFRAAVPGVLSNYLRLERLDRDAARVAIVGPIGRWNEVTPDDEMTAEAELVEAVLDEVAAGRIEPDRDGVGGVTSATLVERIETPYLQLVLERLWDAERAEGSRVLRRDTLRRLGGAARIVEQHLDRSLAPLAADERDSAATLFAYLVTPSGQKIAHRLDDLASYAGLPSDRTAGLVGALARERILRAAEGDRFEIYHDVLAEAVAAWRRDHEIARDRERTARRHRQLTGLLAVAAVVLAAVSALAVYALVQRGEAREQARSAAARALVADASVALETDPARSLRLALAAAELERTPSVEFTLRRALLHPFETRPRRRGTLPPNTVVTRAGVTAVARATFAMVRTGRRELRVNHGAPVTAVDVDRTGTRLVTVGGLRVAKIWDVGSGRLLRQLNGSTAPLLAARFSPDGSLVATGGVDSAVRLYVARSGAVRGTMNRHGNFVTDLDFSADGRTLASSSVDRTARLWEVETGRALGVLVGLRSAAVGVSFERLDRIVVQGRDRTLYTFDGRTEPVLPVLARFGEPVDVARFSRDGRTLEVAAGGEGTRIDAGTGDTLGAIEPPSAASVGAVDGATVRLPSGVVLRGHRRPVTSSVASRDGRLVVTASRDSDVRVWDAQTGALVRLLRGHFGPVAYASFSPDGRFVTTAGPLAAGLFDVGSGRLLFFLRGPAAPLTTAAFDPRSRRIVVASRDGTVRVYACAVCAPVGGLIEIAKRRLQRSAPD